MAVAAWIAVALGVGLLALSLSLSLSPGAGVRTLAAAGVRARVEHAGVRLSLPGGTLTLTDVHVGRAGRMAPAGDRVTVRYAARPAGIEQTLVVHQRPAGTAGAMQVALRSTGSLRPEVVGDALALITATGRVAGRYDELHVVDARGQTLPARLTVDGRRLVIAIDDLGARYPLRVDPLVQDDSLANPQTTPNTPTAFGTSIAVDNAGTTAVVGAPQDGNGEAYIYTDVNGTWSKTATLANPVTTSGTPTAFGTSVAIDANGDTAVVGAPQDGNGEAYIYTDVNGTWSKTATLANPVTTSGTPTAFGTSVAIDGSGHTAVVGAPQDSDGAAYVFTDAQGSGSQTNTGTLANPVTATGQSTAFGTSVTIDANGDTAIVGAPTDGNGAAYVFANAQSSGSQTNTGTLANPVTATGQSTAFGTSVTIDANGDTAIVGAPQDEDGAAYPFEPQGTALHASATPSTVAYGNTVILSASNLPPSATGTVAFATSAQALCTASVSNGGAQCTTPVLGPGTYAVTASYSGEPGQYAASSAGTSFTVAPPPATTTTTTVTTGSPFTFLIPPSVQIGAPVNGARYTRDQLVRASYGCTDGANAPGLSYCEGTVPAGRPVDTSKPGTYAFTVTGASHDGESTIRTLHYVVYLASNAASVTRIAAQGNGRGTVLARVAGPGTVSVSATERLHRRVRALARGVAVARRAGTVRVVLALTPSGRALLRQQRGLRVRLRIAITFAPSGGNPRGLLRYAVVTLR